MGNVIRTIVGHRPYRPDGFVVRSEQYDNKLVVHNYGHGGGGISLSWGSSALALREVRGRAPGEAAVIGSGVMGLTTARLLQDAGWRVVIYTRDMARHTTSNRAAGEWGPFSVHDPTVSTPAFLGQLEMAARIAHHAYTNLGPDYGVSWVEEYQLSETPPSVALEDRPFADLFPYSADLGPGEHPFPSTHVRRIVTMRVEPAILLRRLTQDFLLAGGSYVIREFKRLEEVLGLDEAVIFNCTGLGAAELFGDDKLTPVKGQLVFLPPDSAVDYITIGGGSGLLYMVPRTDALVLGGTYDLGDGSLNPERAQTERIVAGHRRLFEAFG
jgi:glycine/D-amino acid oxidase-like deaminating enzyme